MRGLRLFVRPFERADDVEIRAFLDRQTEDVEARLSNFAWDATPAACGLLGKLLGDIVAVVALEITSDAIRIKDIVVARDLRKKWIGRVMIREVEQLAVKMDRRRLIVDDACGADEFFRRVGFRFEGERWVRVVAS